MRNAACALLSKCSAAQLKSLAELVGINTSATKATLARNLQEELNRAPRIASLAGPGGGSARPTRILSIDMSIRNLAFCVLEVRGDDIMSRGVASDGQSPAAVNDINTVIKSMPRRLDLIKVVKWKRTSLYEALEADIQAQSGTADATGKRGKPLDGDKSPTAMKPETAGATMGKESYDPATFANMTYALVTGVFLPYDISHVLIERQRHRSGGAAAVMEWTVRVNMLESMLHAVFYALRREALEGGSTESPTQTSEQDEREAPAIMGESADLSADHNAWPEEVEAIVESPRWEFALPMVHSISPRKVGVFWDKVSIPTQNAALEPVGDEEVTPRRRGRAAAALPKGKIDKEAKITIAKEFIGAGNAEGLNFSAEAEEGRNAFLGAIGVKGKRKAKQSSAATVSGGSTKTKLDDLADCLLQGAAWVQWEMNRLRFRHALSQIAVSAPGRPVEKPATAQRKQTVKKAQTQRLK